MTTGFQTLRNNRHVRNNRRLNWRFWRINFAIFAGWFEALLLAWLCLPRPLHLDGVGWSWQVFDREGRLLRVTLGPDGRFRLRTALAEVSPEVVRTAEWQEDRYYRFHSPAELPERRAPALRRLRAGELRPRVCRSDPRRPRPQPQSPGGRPGCPTARADALRPAARRQGGPAGRRGRLRLGAPPGRRGSDRRGPRSPLRGWATAVSFVPCGASWTPPSGPAAFTFILPGHRRAAQPPSAIPLHLVMIFRVDML